MADSVRKRMVAAGVSGIVLTALLLAGGCSPKRVTREPATDPASKAAAPAATADPRLPPTSSDRPTSRHSHLDPLPEPRTRVASGATRPAGPPRNRAAESPPSGADLGGRAAGLAKQQLGKPYQWGAAGPEKFDCSGLVMYVYRELGVDLPRVSGQQASAGRHVDRDELRPGDLVFFQLNGSRIDHVGIYVGSSRFVHAPRRYMPVRTDSLNNAYWRRRYRGARRVDDATDFD